MTPGRSTEPEAPPIGGVRTALGVLIFGGTGVVLLHDWFGLGGAWLDEIAAGGLYDAVVVAAGIACLLRSRTPGAARAAWIFLGAGILSWGLGEVYWTVYIDSDPTAPYPSLADALFIALYPLAYVGLALLVRARTHELEWRLWTDGLIAALGTAALGAAFVFDFVADHTTGTPLEVATSLAYPLGDVIMLGFLVGVIALTGWRPGRTWTLLLLGLAFQAAADIAYTLAATGGVVPAGSWIDPLYLLSAAFLGALLWQPEPKSIESPTHLGSGRELMIPAIFAGIMVGLFGLQFLDATSSLSTVLWAATMAAVIVRLALSVRENRALLEQARTDPLTGLGNRGGLQLQLEAISEQARAGRPAAVYLFDLNGFKRYNDTFGHPAGDDLLVMLGRRLLPAVGEDGAVYRIGGDEFCALLTCPEDRFDAVVRRIAQALTVQDRGVEVSASWGGATMPTEADTSSAAMQLADVRMYAQKESRKVARIEGGPAEPLDTLDGAVKVSAWPQPSSDGTPQPVEPTPSDAK
jgi:diguanylate cyclase (GGDEF)-like protein